MGNNERKRKNVRELLARMRGKLVIFLCLFCLCLPANALTLQGGVTYTEQTAREEAFNGVLKYNRYITDRRYFDIYVKNNILAEADKSAKILGIITYRLHSVIFEDEPNIEYVYEKTSDKYKLVSYSVIVQREYPKKIATYTPVGDLMSVEFVVSDNESFVFDKNHKLVSHWIGEKGGTVNNKVKMTIKSKYFVPFE